MHRVALLSLVLAVSGCPKEGRPPAPNGPLLEYVPHDTHLIISGSDLSAALQTDGLAAAWHLVRRGSEGMLAESPNGDLANLAAAFRRELNDDVSPAGLRRVGFSLETEFVVFGVGQFQFFRVNLENAAAFREALSRVALSTGPLFAKKSYKSRGYWQFDLGRLRGSASLALIVAVDGTHLSGALLSVPALEDALPLILGVDRPRKHFSSETLKAAKEKYGLADPITIVDNSRLAAVVTSNHSRLSPDLLPFLPAKTTFASAECVSLLDDISLAVPRYVVGSKPRASKQSETHYILELEPGLASRVGALETQTPTYRGESAALVVSLGVDGKKALRLAEVAVLRLAELQHCGLPGDIVKTARDSLHRYARFVGLSRGQTLVYERFEPLTALFAAQVTNTDAWHEEFARLVALEMPRPTGAPQPASLPWGQGFVHSTADVVGISVGQPSGAPLRALVTSPQKDGRLVSLHGDALYLKALTELIGDSGPKTKSIRVGVTVRKDALVLEHRATY